MLLITEVVYNIRVGTVNYLEKIQCKIWIELSLCYHEEGAFARCIFGLEAFLKPPTSSCFAIDAFLRLSICVPPVTFM